MRIFSERFLVFFAVSFFLLGFVSGCFQSPAPPQPAPTGAPPEIASISPERGCVGRTVTITGKNFGEVQGESRVTFAPCGARPRVEAEVLSWSDTVIEVKVPCGACSGEVVVTVNGLDSNGVAFTVCVCLPLPEPVSGPSGPVYNTTQNKYYTTIQAAIDDAQNNDVIVVSPGTYSENIDFKGKNITLRSTDPNHPEYTVIEGSGGGPVVTFVGVRRSRLKGKLLSAVLQGFTIQNASGDNGVGVYLEGASLIIEQNIITGNEDGGIYVKSGYAEISNNTITGNTARLGGGGIFVGDGYARIDGNTITGNTAKSESDNGGGGILVYGSGSSADISGNRIENNKAFSESHSGPGGGIAVTSGATVGICCGNTISGNSPNDVYPATLAACATPCSSPSPSPSP